MIAILLSDLLLLLGQRIDVSGGTGPSWHEPEWIRSFKAFIKEFLYLDR